MKRIMHVWFVGALIALALPGCGRVVDWARDNFAQGALLDHDLLVVRNHMRSVRVYEQFSTLGKFDTLWLSDPVRSTYVAVHGRKHGMDKERENALLRRQLAENKHYITFYVLGLVEHSLTDQNGDWSLFLEVDGNNFKPMEVRIIDLPAEYQLFFGKRISPFKIAYSVKFNAQDIEDKPLIGPDTKEIALHFRTTRKEAVMRWPVGEAA